MKTLIRNILLAGAMGLAAATAHAFNPVRYVQISTNAVSQQSGSYNVSGGTVTTLNITGTGSFLGVITATNTSNTFQSANSTFTTLNATTIKNSGTTGISLAPTGVGILGTTTNDNATAGNYGEFISSKTAAATNISTGVVVDLLSIPLTTGDWDLTGSVEWVRNGATLTSGALDYLIGYSVTSGNSTAGLSFPDTRFDMNNVFPTTFSTAHMVIPRSRISINASTTYYFKGAVGDSSAGTQQYQAIMTARRVR